EADVQAPASTDGNPAPAAPDVAPLENDPREAGDPALMNDESLADHHGVDADAEQTEAQPRHPPPADPPAPAIVPRRLQLVLLPIALLALWALARASGPVLLILIAASTVALILNPLVKILQRRLRIDRGVAIFAVYVGFFAAVAGIGVLLANPISTQISRF